MQSFIAPRAMQGEMNEQTSGRRTEPDVASGVAIPARQLRGTAPPALGHAAVPFGSASA